MVAAALPAAVAVPLLPTAAHPGVPHAWPMVLIDDRHAEARAFGAWMTGRGTPVRAVPDGDISKPWREWIGPAFGRAPTVVAGLTRAPALFCLEQLSWALHGQVVFYAEHLVPAVGPVRHRIHRCAPSGKAVDEVPLSPRGGLWPGQLASLVARQSGVARSRRAAPTHIDLATLPSDYAQRLTSWIIATA